MRTAPAAGIVMSHVAVSKPMMTAAPPVSVTAIHTTSRPSGDITQNLTRLLQAPCVAFSETD
jgi:hypothetical protein